MAKFNIFEGSRRVALLLKILWVLGVIVVSYNQSPYVSLKFTTTQPDAPFVVSDYDCQIGIDHMEFETRSLDDGHAVSVQLCFRSQVFQSNQQRLVPYKVEGDTMWGNDRYSSEVTNYAEARANDFRLSPADQQMAREEWDRQRSRNIRNAVLFAIGGWIVLSVLQWIIGWIVRGFLGIPRGSDHKPQPPSPTVVVASPE
jgi:hypothetical protein